MTRNILVRVAQAVLALLFLTSLVFLLVRVTGDPASFLTGPSANAADRARVRQELGLDRP